MHYRVCLESQPCCSEDCSISHGTSGQCDKFASSVKYSVSSINCGYLLCPRHKKLGSVGCHNEILGKAPGLSYQGLDDIVRS